MGKGVYTNMCIEVWGVGNKPDVRGIFIKRESLESNLQVTVVRKLYR